VRLVRDCGAEARVRASRRQVQSTGAPCAQNNGGGCASICPSASFSAAAAWSAVCQQQAVQREQARNAHTSAAPSDAASLSCGRKGTSAPGSRCVGFGSDSQGGGAALPPPPRLKLGALARSPPTAAMPRRGSGGAGRCAAACEFSSLVAPDISVVATMALGGRTPRQRASQRCSPSEQLSPFRLSCCCALAVTWTAPPMTRLAMSTTLLLQQPAATHAVPRCRRASRRAAAGAAARAQAPADTASPARLQRRALLASLGALLVSRPPPQAHASGSPYDDVLPDVGVLNGCVRRHAGLAEAALTRGTPALTRGEAQALAVVPEHFQLRVDQQPQQRPVHRAVGGQPEPENREGGGGRDRGGGARAVPAGRAANIGDATVGTLCALPRSGTLQSSRRARVLGACCAWLSHALCSPRCCRCATRASAAATSAQTTKAACWSRCARWPEPFSVRARCLAACASPDARRTVVYPFMTPVSDGGLQKSRMVAIRDQLRWRLVGCELQECYAQ
jgi:hypothetical protein